MLARAIALVAGCTILVGYVFALPATAATAGRAQIVHPGTITPLTSGGSGTDFGILLPGGAHCPGDSTRRPWYQAGSYLVPKGTNPASVIFGGVFPEQGLLLASAGAPFEHVNVEEGTGDVLVAEKFDIQRFTASDLLPGGVRTAIWEAGIACADYQGHVSDYWNVQLTFTASASDPEHYTWKVDGPNGGGSGSPWPLIVGLVIAVGAAFAAVRVRMTGRRAGRRSRTARLS
jgi:hypothetical protein